MAFHLFKPQVLKNFLNETTSAKLVVVITNEKNPVDGALVSAVKNYWKHGEVRYMSTVEFEQKKSNNSLSPSDYYLFYPFAALKEYTFAFGYCLCNRPNEINYKNKLFYLTFSSSNMVSNNRMDVVQGYFDLMIKNFNYEIEEVKAHTDKYLNKSKKAVKKDKDGYTYFKDKTAFNDKSILLIKNQVSKKAKPITKQEKKQARRDEANMAKVKVDDKEVKEIVVFDEDIDYAVSKSDESVILSNSGTLYSAKDGSIYRTKDYAYKRSAYSYISTAISGLSVVAVIVFLIVN